MLGFILGMLTTVCIALTIVLVYIIKKPEKTAIEEKTEKEIEKDKAYNDHFNSMMNYDAKKAYGGK